MVQKQITRRLLLYLITALTFFSSFSEGFPRIDAMAAGTKAKAKADEYAPLPKAGEKCWISGDHYLIYEFDKKPQMGTIILKIQVFTKNGKQDSSLEIVGDTGMPSMKGAHESGPQAFKLNRKGDYLLPVNVVMPGEWEIRINVLKEKQNLLSGSIRFRI